MLSDLYYYARVTSTKFVVKNIAPGNKTVKVFSYPVYNGYTRDLLMIPGVSEADIRYSLLKGDLYIKLKYKELIVVESNIDLLQFNDEQRTFLETNGVVEGLAVTDIDNGGGGTLTPITVQIDLGSVPVFSKSFTVTDSNVTSSSKIFTWLIGPTPGLAPDEIDMDNIFCTAVAQNGYFDLFIAALPGPVVGTRKIAYVVTI